MSRSYLKRKADKRVALLSFAVLAFLCVRAGDVKYPVSAIAKELKENANVVKRMEESVFEIVSTKEARLHYKYALTILNENGDSHAGFSEWYDQFRHIRFVEGFLYDANGKLIKKMKTKDLSDVSAVDGLMDDNRVREFNFYCRSYPYTVEFEANLTIDHTFYFPGWLPQEYENLGVEEASFKVVMPADYVLRYKTFNYKGDPVTASEKNKKSYTWSVQNLPAVKREPFGPRWHQITTTVSIAPTDFQIQGIKGTMTGWKDFGRFIYELKKGRDELPENIQQKVATLTANARDDLEKIQILYRFLQKNTRYISIQLGIGGWQPFEAADVAKKGYGDCKALSNYMYSLLKAAGIKSYYALVKAGEYDHYLMEDFPCNQFNHVIVCVPMQKDSVWLECTSQDLPPGYMSEFTGNRKALLIDENGGTLVSTPRYGIRENILVRNVKAKMDAAGTLNLKVGATYSGVQQDDLSMMINALSREKVEKVLQRGFQMASYDVKDFKYQETKGILPQLNEDLDITVNRYGTVSGKRIFLEPNMMNRSNTRFNADEKRTADLVFYLESREEDNYEIEIPSGYEPETMPADVTLKTKFGTYRCSTKLEGSRIIYHRERENFSGTFPAKDQGELASFFDAIYKADRGRVVLVKKAS